MCEWDAAGVAHLPSIYAHLPSGRVIPEFAERWVHVRLELCPLTRDAECRPFSAASAVPKRGTRPVPLTAALTRAVPAAASPPGRRLHRCEAAVTTTVALPAAAGDAGGALAVEVHADEASVGSSLCRIVQVSHRTVHL